MDTIRTTHTGSLPRPDDLTEMVLRRDDGGQVDGFEERLRTAIEDIVRQQVDAGVGIVSDGEQGKVSYVSYVKDRLTGFEGESASLLSRAPFKTKYPEFNDRLASRAADSRIARGHPSCVGPIRYGGHADVQRDIANLRAAADAAGADEIFMPAPSPGNVARYFANAYYSNEDEYRTAIADAMAIEYRTICNAGITVQLDSPDLASGVGALGTLEERRRHVARDVELLNYAVAGLPADRLRMHVCWGNYDGPHDYDVELGDIVDLLLAAVPAGLAIEAANPRHSHEWEVFADVELPDGKYLIPGVIESTNNFVEHPRAVAQRIMRYARLVGPERVVAGSDCGFGTWVDSQRTVVPSVVWGKLRSAAEGADIAARELRARAIPG